MTAEMMSGISNSPAEEISPEIPEEAQPSSGLSQAQINSVNFNQPPSSNDPFSISKNRINAEVRPNLGNSALFEKLNGSKSTVTPIMGGTLFQGPDTPTGYGGAMSPEIMYGKEVGGAVTTIPSSTEPPTAPARKGRTLQGLGLDFSIDAAPKMRSNSVKSKSQSKGDSEEVDITAASRSSTQSSAIGQLKRTVSGQPSQSISTNSSLANTNSNDPMAPQRRSVRLFNQIRPGSGKFAAPTASASLSLGARDGRELKKVKATGTKGRGAHTNVGRVVSGNRKHNDGMDVDGKEQRPLSTIQSGIPSTNPKPVVNDKVKEYESLQWLLDLFCKLGTGYFALSHFQCEEAIPVFNSITPSQRDTPWVLAQIGRALYEQSSYAEAAKFFARIRIMAPARMEDMEFYSTILWHLKNEIDLAFLAHEIIEIDRDSPQAWCAVGNSFSLQNDHEQALKCFKRATQLDPKFVYGYTLQGHEHMFLEEVDKAFAAYRSSIAAEPRYWRGWYGLGKVFEKQGKWDFAEQHYRTAAGINPTNALLVRCIGFMLEQQKNLKAALAQYSRSCEMAPKIALTRYNKARVLKVLREPEKALVELKILKDITPDEANVHFLLAEVYKALKQKSGAIKHYTIALNLDPKVSREEIFADP